MEVIIMKSNRLETLNKKIEQLEAQKSSVIAKLKAKAKEKDTRKKILVGSYFLKKAEKEGSMDELIKKMDNFLTRKNDRLLFNLPDLKDPSKNI